jgi:hypothetical protein
LVSHKEVQRVKENENLLVRIENKDQFLENPSIWVGRARMWSFDRLEGNTTRDVTINVGDFVGDTVITMKDKNGEEICEPIKLVVEPRGLTSEEFNEIRHERIPSLLKKFGAENVHDVVYKGGYATYKIEVEDYAVSELLNHYSKELLDITKKIQERLTYISKKEVKKYKSEIKGKIKWQRTMRLRFQKGLSHATAHVCERRKRSYLTPTNLLFLKFHYEVFTEGATMLTRLQQRETEKMRWKSIYKQGGRSEYDRKVIEILNDLRGVLRVHKFVLQRGRFRESLPHLRVIARDNPQLIRQAESEAVRAKNPAYGPLIELYKDFVDNYKSTFMTTVPIDTQRMGDFYRVWAMCEIADALELKSIGHTMREFKNRHETIYMYFQNLESLRHPWSEIVDDTVLYMGSKVPDVDLSFIGPEMYVAYEGTDVFIDTIYGRYPGGLPREKIYQVLGYMNDFGFTVGVVLYPGFRFHIKSDLRNPAAPKILIEAPLIPQISKTKQQSDKKADYLRYLVWAAVILQRAAKRNEDLGRVIKSITRTVEVKHSNNT